MGTFERFNNTLRNGVFLWSQKTKLKVSREVRRISGYCDSSAVKVQLYSVEASLPASAIIYPASRDASKLITPPRRRSRRWKQVGKGEGGLRLTCTSSRFPWTRRWRCWDTAMSCTRSAAARCTLGAHYHLRRHIRRAANGNRAIQVTCQLRRRRWEHTRLWHRYLYEPTDLLAVEKQQIHVYILHICACAIRREGGSEENAGKA